MANVKKERYCDENGTITDENGNIIVEYPSNSHKSKINEFGLDEGVDKDKNNKKIIKGNVIEKRSVSKEIKNSFINAGEYILKDVLIPDIKNTVSEIVKNTIDMILFGEVNRGRSNKTYASYSNNNKLHTYSYKNKIMDDIILESKGDAEDIIDELLNYIDKYGSATIADLYELIGKKSEYTDNDYGWTNLASANVRRVAEGYLLEMPKPICLK